MLSNRFSFPSELGRDTPSAGFTYRLYGLKPSVSRSKGLQQTVVRIESMAGI